MGSYPMELPHVRPGKMTDSETMPKVVAFFRDASLGNTVIQLVAQLGVPSDRIGVTPPERMPKGRGMLASFGCPNDSIMEKVEILCRKQGAEIHRQRT